MPSLPQKRVDDCQSAQIHNQLVDFAKSLRPMRGDGNQTTHSIYGVSRVTPKARGGGGGSIQGFVLVSDGGDYYNCNTFNGVTTGTGFIKVAKDPDLRCILKSAGGGAYPPVLPATTGSGQVKRGITYTYTYTPSYATTADGVGIVEYMRGVTGSDGSSKTSSVTPFLGVGSILYAQPATFAGPSTLVGVQWLAIGSFAWTDA